MKDINKFEYISRNKGCKNLTTKQMTKVWVRWILTAITSIISLLLFVLMLGVLIPSITYIGEAGTFFNQYFSLNFIIVSLIFSLISLLILKIGGRKAAVICLSLSIMNVVGYTIPFISMMNAANNYGVNISVTKLLGPPQFTSSTPDITKSVKYASVDNKDLYMDISKPNSPNSAINLTPIVVVHGGGFVMGTRNENNEWTKFYNDRGYVVFDVDYRLATKSYHTWDKASADVATAIVWIGNHADNYNIDMNKLLIAGYSAGGCIALNVAYGIQDGSIKAYEPGKLFTPKAVVTLYPSDDSEAMWAANTELFVYKGRYFLEQYTGGSPETVASAYKAIDPSNHITENTPPTLVVTGRNDHLVPYDSHVNFINKLNKYQIPNTLITIPYNDHGFDLVPNSIGGQIAFQKVSKFLEIYAK